MKLSMFTNATETQSDFSYSPVVNKTQLALFILNNGRHLHLVDIALMHRSLYLFIKLKQIRYSNLTGMLRILYQNVTLRFNIAL